MKEVENISKKMTRVIRNLTILFKSSNNYKKNNYYDNRSKIKANKNKEYFNYSKFRHYT